MIAFNLRKLVLSCSRFRSPLN